MAIINTFDRCLDSPFLVRDPAAPARAGALLEQAGDLLGAARDILGGAKPDPADVGSLAYQAMFAAIRALVYAKGYREAGLRCLVLACEGLYVRSGRLDAGQLVAFERVQGYKVPPADAVALAGALIERAGTLIGEDRRAEAVATGDPA